MDHGCAGAATAAVRKALTSTADSVALHRSVTL